MHLSDLISYGQLALCKAFRRPEEAFLSSQERASRWQQMSGTSKRQRISDETDKKLTQKNYYKSFGINCRCPHSLYQVVCDQASTRVRFSRWRPAFAKRQVQPLGSAVGDLQLPILREGSPVAWTVATTRRKHACIFVRDV